MTQARDFIRTGKEKFANHFFKTEAEALAWVTS